MPPTVLELMHEMTMLYAERRKTYGEKGYKRTAAAMAELFPKGITLLCAEDHARFQLLLMTVIKLGRYCQNFTKGGHEDSCRDASLYWLLLQELDYEIAGEEADKVAEEARGCSCEEDGPGEGQEVSINERGEKTYIQGSGDSIKERSGIDRRQDIKGYSQEKLHGGYWRSGGGRRTKKGTKADRAS